MYKNPLECKGNIFITGSGGTGKTYAINDYMKKHSDTTLLCASTGTAAVNIGGSTAHRLFSIPVPAYGQDPEKLTPSKLQVFSQGVEFYSKCCEPAKVAILNAAVGCYQLY